MGTVWACGRWKEKGRCWGGTVQATNKEGAGRRPFRARMSGVHGNPFTGFPASPVQCVLPKTLILWNLEGEMLCLSYAGGGSRLS